MAGLLDAHTMGSNTQALQMVVAMADYHHARTKKVLFRAKVTWDSLMF